MRANMETTTLGTDKVCHNGKKIPEIREKRQNRIDVEEKGFKVVF